MFEQNYKMMEQTKRLYESLGKRDRSKGWTQLKP